MCARGYRNPFATYGQFNPQSKGSFPHTPPNHEGPTDDEGIVIMTESVGKSDRAVQLVLRLF